LIIKRTALLLVSFALVAIIAGCFAAQLYQQQNFSYSQSQSRHISISNSESLNAITINHYILLAVTPSLTVQAPTNSQTMLSNNTRNQIFDYINQNPGIQFRAICSALCLPVGLAEYHLGVLVKSGLVSFVRDGRYKRFFGAKRFSKRDMALICLLRHKTAKRILEALLGKRELSHGRLADEVSITSQALTWQMKTLGNTEFLLQVNEGLKIIYRLDETSEPRLKTCLAIVNQ
jgi:DNA-binding transcriptional ArsR family regulator